MVRTYSYNPSTSTKLDFHDIGFTPRDRKTLRKQLLTDSNAQILPDFASARKGTPLHFRNKSASLNSDYGNRSTVTKKPLSPTAENDINLDNSSISFAQNRSNSLPSADQRTTFYNTWIKNGYKSESRPTSRFNSRWQKEEQLIIIPREQAIIIEPVFAGNQSLIQSDSEDTMRKSGNDIERTLRENDRSAKVEYQKALQRQIEEQRMLKSAQEQENRGRGGRPPRTPDFDRQVRNAQKLQQQQYLQDLQNQMAEQKMKRVQTEIDYGGQRVRQEAMKARRDMEDGNPPWLRGNPQPTTGVRSSDLYLSGSSSYHPPQQLQRQRSLPLDYGFSQHPTTPGQIPQGLQHNDSGFNYVSPFSCAVPAGNDPISSALHHQQDLHFRAQQQKRVQEEQLFEQKQRLENNRMRREAQDEEDYDPFGKGGGGAPMRDKDGRLITDRRRMRRSWNTVQDTNLPHNYQSDQINPSQSINTGFDQPVYGSNSFKTAHSIDSPFNFGSSADSVTSSVVQASSFVNQQNLSEKDRHQLELKKQIEERKRQRELERLKEKEEEEKERLRIERDNAKIQAELEEERRKQREKIAQQERKQAEMAELQRKKAEEMAEARKAGGRNREGPRQNQPQEPDGLEWWEKKPARRQPSRASYTGTRAAKTTVATPPPEALFDSAQTLQSEEVSTTPPPLPRHPHAEKQIGTTEDEESNKQFKPRSAMVRNEGVMRQLSAMRERLTKEQVRVRSALRRKEYGDDLFSDEEVPVDNDVKELDLDDVPSLTNIKSKSKKNKTSKTSRSSSAYSGLFEEDSDENFKPPKSRQQQRNSQNNTTEEDEDPPLVSLIKNSRTTLSDLPVPSRTSRRQSRKMNGFLSSEDDDDGGGLKSPRHGGLRGSSRMSLHLSDEDTADRIVKSYKSRGKSSSSYRRRPSSEML